MSYIKKESIAENKRFNRKLRYVQKYYTTIYHPKGAKRSKAENKTKTAQAKVNARNREITLWLRIEANFGHGDSHSALHYYRCKPAGLEEAEKDLDNALRLCRKKCKKAGVEFLWIAVTETKGKKGELFHHHIIVNREAQEFLAQAWEEALEKAGRQGKTSSSRLDKRDSHRELAAYLLKQSERTMEQWAALGYTRKQRWRASRNLNIPKTKKKIITANQWAKEPKPQKGEWLAKNANGDTYEMGIHDVTGWPWMEYVAVSERRIN